MEHQKFGLAELRDGLQTETVSDDLANGAPEIAT